MKQLLTRRKPSPAMVVAVLALFISLAGTALAGPIAEISGLNKRDKRVVRKLSRKISNQRITARAPGLAVASAGTASSASTAKTADSATTADNAGNANALGGVLASGYVRNGCDSPTGQIRGFARVPAEASFSSTFTDVSEAYNCSGEAVQAKRDGVGSYEVQFLGSSVTVATGNIVNDPATFDDAFVSFTRVGPGHFQVRIYNAVLSAREDRPFSVLTP